MSLVSMFQSSVMACHFYLYWWAGKSLDTITSTQEFAMGKKPDHFRQAVRGGDLKALRYGVDSPIKVFNLTEDESEKNDIANQHPELVERVKKIFENDRTANSAFPYQNNNAWLECNSLLGELERDRVLLVCNTMSFKLNN